MATTENGVVDSGHPHVHFHVMAHTNGEDTTTFDIPPEVMTPSLGFPMHHADLAGHLAHTAEILHCDTPSPVGLTLTADGVQYGGTHAAHVVADQHSTRGFHHVAFPGDGPVKHPVAINIQHNNGLNLKQNVTQTLKRHHRWKNDIGVSEEQLMAGLEIHHGEVKGQPVKRVLVPTDGDHPVTRALQLNTNGHLSQYGPQHRTTVDVGGQTMTIMEEAHAQSICKTLASNLKIQTPLANHGMKIMIRPLEKGGKPGKVRIQMRISKENAHTAIQADDTANMAAHPRNLATNDINTVISDPSAPTITPNELKDKVLNATLRGSSVKLPEPAPDVKAPVLDLPDASSKPV